MKESEEFYESLNKFFGLVIGSRVIGWFKYMFYIILFWGIF